jgi:Polysaccharide lyase family 4, domain II
MTDVTAARMKFFLPILLGLLQAANAYAQSAPTVGASPVAVSQKCSVEGTVFRKDTGEPLSKAKVQLETSEKPEDSTFDVTDAHGNFLLDDLSCHAYRLRVFHPGFVETEYGKRANSDPGAMLSLAPGQKVTGLIFRLQRTAVITGHVYDETGQLVEGVSIRVIRMTGRGERREYQQVGSASTNDLGEFRVFDLEPGRYYLAAVYDPWPAREGLDIQPKRKLLKKGYPTLYYPNTIDPGRGQSFSVNAGEELPPIDLQLQLTSMNSVSGRILNIHSAKNTDRADVYLWSNGSSFTGVDLNDREAQTRDGLFSIYRVPPGSYILQAVYRDRETMQPVWARRKVEVEDGDLEGVTLSFAPTFSLQAHLTWDDTPSLEVPNPLYIFFSPTGPDTMPGSSAMQPKPDGAFLIQNLSEGEYRPFLRSQDEDCFIKSGHLGSLPMVDGKLQIPGPTDNFLELALTCRAAHLAGQVLTSDSLPAVGVFVVLVPDEHHRDDADLYFSCRTDQNGHFLIKGIRPGDYKLFSWSGIEEYDWLDADFLQSFEAKGIPVQLEEGDRKNLDATLLETGADASPKH